MVLANEKKAVREERGQIINNLKLKEMTYSEIVDRIQNDTDVAADLLVDIAIDQQNALDNIKKIEKELQKANNRFSATMKEIEMVCKHVKKEPHFHITKDHKYYHFNQNYQVRVSDIDWEL